MFGISRKKIRRWLTAILVIYVLIGLLIYFFQEKILFQPKVLSFDHRYQISEPYREINLPVNEGKNLAIVQFMSTDPICKGVVLYFHGNKKNIERYAGFAPLFTRRGFEVWMMDYPGFGKSTGKRSESIMYADAHELYKMARARFSEDSIIVYGKSMGTGVAAQLASLKNCRRLILETPYYDCPSALNQYVPIYPMNWLIKYQFPTHQYLRDIAAPVTIIQGSEDGVIKHSNAKRLIKSLKQTDEFVSIPGGSHNNLYDFPYAVKKLDSLLAK
jgi:uncharacterized protein